jgi:hypothetical protein
LCGNDYGVRERVGGFQGVGKININNLSNECVWEKGDICIISRIRGVVRTMGKGIRSSEFGSWDMMEF